MAERRRNALTGDWVVVSADRVQRPWQGATESRLTGAALPWQADCYLCPGNDRAGGTSNADYRGTYVFDNDFPALSGIAAPASDDALLQMQPVSGTCRVLCYSHRHDATLATLSEPELLSVVELWQAQTNALMREHAWVQIFENKGELMGCSSPHPHGQVWATSHVPTLAAREEESQRAYASNGGNLLRDYAARELTLGERVVARNNHWVALVPFWATWPFELLLLPLGQRVAFGDLDGADRTDLARILRTILRAYDALFGASFPYSMGWHGRGRDHGDHWQLHAHFYPPLLRSATVRKFMVGFEMLAEAQRDFSPESAAQRLRDLTTR